MKGRIPLCGGGCQGNQATKQMAGAKMLPGI